MGSAANNRHALEWFRCGLCGEWRGGAFHDDGTPHAKVASTAHSRRANRAAETTCAPQDGEIRSCRRRNGRDDPAEHRALRSLINPSIRPVRSSAINALVRHLDFGHTLILQPLLDAYVGCRRRPKGTRPRSHRPCRTRNSLSDEGGRWFRHYWSSGSCRSSAACNAAQAPAGAGTSPRRMCALKLNFRTLAKLFAGRHGIDNLLVPCQG
jgi:hypothetical protein